MKNTLLINERGPDFHSTHQIAEQPSYAWLTTRGEVQIDEEEYHKALGALEGKKVLVLIHGLKNLQDDVFESYTHAHKQIANIFYPKSPASLFDRVQDFIYSITGFWQPKPEKAYDAVIGISWPSYHHELYYYHAKENAQLLAPKVATHLFEISKVAQRVDVLAHSLGNYMLFEALKTKAATSLKVHHIYSLAAAVARHSLNAGGTYETVSEKCTRLFILFSEKDDALQWPFYLAEGGETALGLFGADHQKKLASNITSVDCSKIATEHSAYLYQPLFYQFIENSHKPSLPYFPEHNEVEINADGKISTRT